MAGGEGGLCKERGGIGCDSSPMASAPLGSLSAATRAISSGVQVFPGQWLVVVGMFNWFVEGGGVVF